MVWQLEAEARERAAAQARQDIADAAALRRQHDQRVNPALMIFFIFIQLLQVREVMKGLLIKAAREERALTGSKLATDTVGGSFSMTFFDLMADESGTSFVHAEWHDSTRVLGVRQRVRSGRPCF